MAAVAVAGVASAQVTITGKYAFAYQSASVAGVKTTGGLTTDGEAKHKSQKELQCAGHHSETLGCRLVEWHRSGLLAIAGSLYGGIRPRAFLAAPGPVLFRRHRVSAAQQYCRLYHHLYRRELE